MILLIREPEKDIMKTLELFKFQYDSINSDQMKSFDWKLLLNLNFNMILLIPPSELLLIFPTKFKFQYDSINS